jgi:tRNA dimethylallyltransferase
LSEFPPVVAIVGPTAVGKSALALALAAHYRGDILSADSRQVYRYMDIGTAKPSAAERSAVTHHLIDVVTPADVYSAQLFRQEGLQVLRRLAAQQRPALVVGGTGFYLRALLDGDLFPAVPPNHPLRAALAQEAAERGPQALHDRLAQLDPASASRVHANNLPRVIRALEIVDALGGPVPPSTTQHAVAALWLGLTQEPSRLGRTADRRAWQQIKNGLVEEVRLLLAMGYSAESPALQGFGYREMISYLRGELSLGQALAGYQLAQRQFIRRQMTWFRANRSIHWLDVEGDVEGEARSLIDDWLSSHVGGA